MNNLLNKKLIIIQQYFIQSIQIQQIEHVEYKRRFQYPNREK